MATDDVIPSFAPALQSMKSLPTKERTLEELFYKISKGKDSISFDVFYDSIKNNHIKSQLTKNELKTQWIIIDVDGNDEMDLNEFKSLMKSQFGPYDNKKQIQIAFNNIKNELMPDNHIDLLRYSSISTRASVLKKNVAIGISSRAIKSTRENKKKMQQKFKDIFDSIDADGNGTIDLDEMFQVITILKLDMTKSELQNLFNFYDTDKNGKIQFDEFQRLMTSQLTKIFGDGAVELTKVWTQENITKVKESTRASKLQGKKFAFGFGADIKSNDDNNSDTKQSVNDVTQTDNDEQKVSNNDTPNNEPAKPNNDTNTTIQNSDTIAKTKANNETTTSSTNTDAVATTLKTNNDNTNTTNVRPKRVSTLNTKKGTIKSKRASQIIEEETSEYYNPKKNDVINWDNDKVIEWIKYVFKHEADKDEIERYVTIFKTLKVDGKRLVTMEHRTDWFALKIKDKDGNLLKITNVNGKRHVTFGYRKVKKIIDPTYQL